MAGLFAFLNIVIIFAVAVVICAVLHFALHVSATIMLAAAVVFGAVVLGLGLILLIGMRSSHHG